MKYIVLFIVFIGIHTSCYSGCFHAKDGVLIIDSLVKRWKFFEQNEIIDSLKKIGVKVTVGTPYKEGLATLTDIIVEKSSLNSLFQIQDLKINWSFSKQNGKIKENKSGFSFEVPNIEANLGLWYKRNLHTLHPFLTMRIFVWERYGKPTEQSHEYVTSISTENDYTFNFLERIRKQDPDKIKKDKVQVRWFEETTQKGTSYIYDVEMISTVDNLLEFQCHWTKLLK